MRKKILLIIGLLAISTIVGYFALTKSAAPSQSTGSIKIIFRPNFPKEQFLEFVVDSRLRIVSENIANNSVELQVPQGEEEKYLEALRTLPEVKSVQFNYESNASFTK